MDRRQAAAPRTLLAVAGFATMRAAGADRVVQSRRAACGCGPETAAGPGVAVRGAHAPRPSFATSGRGLLPLSAARRVLLATAALALAAQPSAWCAGAHALLPRPRQWRACARLCCANRPRRHRRPAAPTWCSQATAASTLCSSLARATRSATASPRSRSTRRTTTRAGCRCTRRALNAAAFFPPYGAVSQYVGIRAYVPTNRAPPRGRSRLTFFSWRWERRSTGRGGMVRRAQPFRWPTRRSSTWPRLGAGGGTSLVRMCARRARAGSGGEGRGQATASFAPRPPLFPFSRPHSAESRAWPHRRAPRPCVAHPTRAATRTQRSHTHSF